MKTTIRVRSKVFIVARDYTAARNKLLRILARAELDGVISRFEIPLDQGR